MIKVTNLIKSYGEGELKQDVLKSLSFEIKSGQFVSIIGPSGAGKSTLLYQIGLLDHPTSGEIEIDGIQTSSMSTPERTEMRLNRLGYVFQDYALLPELTAYENTVLPLRMMGLNRRECDKLALTSLKKIGLDNKTANLPSQLSGGQQQRVAIARAIAHSPEILFADEPTANLDSENSKLVIQAFIELHKAGQTIVMVTHEDEYANKSQRIIGLRDGNIEFDK